MLLTSASRPAVIAAERPNPVLPPPANVTVDFDRDILPIFQESCFRCHGPERPKSGFRLDDRAAALKGGRNNDDNIVPGDSAGSRLIHYVAQMDEEMTMPPPEQADPLSSDQVALLRAWIDQGASWGASAVWPEEVVTATAQVRWIELDGDARKFRELAGIQEGLGGGMEEFRVEQQIGADERISAEGRFLFPEEDFRLRLEWSRKDAGFVRGGFETWRRYFDDSGGFYRPFATPQFELNRDLQLDVGRAWMDFGLTLPNWPLMVLGYEYQFRDGAKSTLHWGNANGRSVYPAYRVIDERTHVVKLDVRHEVNGWLVEDRARVEYYRSRTRDERITTYTSGPQPDGFVRVRQELNHVQGANALRVERQWTDWWLGSAGYLYSRLEGDSALQQSTLDAQEAPVFGYHWNHQVTLRREMHVASVANQLQPFEGLSLSAGAQARFSRQEGFGAVNLDLGDPGNPDLFFLQPGRVRSDLDQRTFSELAGARFSQIPFTILFAEARLEQDAIGQFERETGSTPDLFLRETDYRNHRREWKAGFSVSPWRWISWNAHYKGRESDSDYDHRRDESLFNGQGYSAFITGRSIELHEADTKLVLHPMSWLKTAISYRWSESRYEVETDALADPFFGEISPGGRRRSGRHEGNTAGFHLTLSPVRRLSLSGSLLYSESRAITVANESPAVAPYRGETWSVIASAHYLFGEKTVVAASYSLTQSRFGQRHISDGLPLGLDFTQQRLMAGVSRKLSPRVTSGLNYSFFDYSETSSRGFNDFTGHGCFAVVTVKLR